MGFGAATKLLRVLEGVSQVLAVEFMCAAQGVDQRAPLTPAPGTASLHATIRSHVPKLEHDRPIGADIDVIAELIRNGDLA